MIVDRGGELSGVREKVDLLLLRLRREENGDEKSDRVVPEVPGGVTERPAACDNLFGSAWRGDRARGSALTESRGAAGVQCDWW